jgi:hypothetical protein
MEEIELADYSQVRRPTRPPATFEEEELLFERTQRNYEGIRRRTNRPVEEFDIDEESLLPRGQRGRNVGGWRSRFADNYLRSVRLRQNSYFNGMRNPVSLRGAGIGAIGTAAGGIAYTAATDWEGFKKAITEGFYPWLNNTMRHIVPAGGFIPRMERRDERTQREYDQNVAESDRAAKDRESSRELERQQQEYLDEQQDLLRTKDKNRYVSERPYKQDLNDSQRKHVDELLKQPDNATVWKGWTAPGHNYL